VLLLRLPLLLRRKKQSDCGPAVTRRPEVVTTISLPVRQGKHRSRCRPSGRG